MQPNPRYTTILTQTVKRTYKRSPPPPPEDSGLAPPLLSTQAVKWSGRLCLARKTGPSYVALNSRLDIFPTPLGQLETSDKTKKATSMSRYIPCLAFNSHSCWGNLWRADFPSQGLIATPSPPPSAATSSTWPHYPRTWHRVKTSRCGSNTRNWSGVGTLSNSLVVLHPSWYTWVHAGFAMPAGFLKKSHQSNLFAW